MNMNEINIQEYNLAYALLRGIGDRRQRIRAMVALYNDIHESTGGAGCVEAPPPLAPTRPSILRCLFLRARGCSGPTLHPRHFTPCTGAPPTPDPLPTQNGAPVCLFGPGGDYVTEWPKRA